MSFSSLEEFTTGKFLPVVDEIDKISKNKVKKIILCSGKIYFDLYETRAQHGVENCAIIRLEQFHPFPKTYLESVLNKYKEAEELVWVQEEPRNQGAWSYLLSRRHLGGSFDESKPLKCVARPYSSSPAVGYLSKHEEQQKTIVSEALDLHKAKEFDRKSA